MRKSVGHKTCPECGQYLPIMEFGVNLKNLDGLMSKCRKCSRHEVQRECIQRRRARKLEATVETFTRAELIRYWIDNSIDPDICIYCGGPHEHDDHVIPLSRGGTHERANLMPACASCNCSKGDKLLEEWRPEVFSCAS